MDVVIVLFDTEAFNIAKRKYSVIAKVINQLENELIKNLEKIHTTEMGLNRIKRNLALECNDVVDWCKNQIKFMGLWQRAVKLN